MRSTFLASVLCLSFVGSCMAQAVPGPESRVETRIPPQALRQALASFAAARHIQVLYLTAALKGLRTPGAYGELTADETLVRLLSGTGLKFRHVDSNAISIIADSSPNDPARRTPPNASSKPRLRAADRRGVAVTHKHSDPPAGPRRSRKPPATGNAPPALQEVIVTGTHISGGPPPSAPIITITREDIQDSGYQSVEQVMDSLPENFASVGSAQSFDIASQSNAQNDANGVAVNLNGLGFDSTLVLVNGHRLAPSGAGGAFTDISVIPLSAIERIEVMTEGASAIYGSDAVGGVVNFILKSHQEGEETALEYGSVTKGGLKDYRVSQSAGGSWKGGSGLISYEYHQQTPLSGEDRPFSRLASAYEPTDLLPGLVQNAMYATASQNIDTNTTLETDVLYEHRDARTSLMDTEPLVTASASQQFSGGVEVSHRMWNDWEATGRVAYGENNATSGDPLGTDHDASRLLSIDAGVTGPLLHIPSGPIKAAFGAEARREAFSFAESGPYASTLPPIDRSRMVYALYGETRIPLLRGARMSMPALASLDLAARYEHYTDFGSSLDPMAGLAWEPVRLFRVRATAGWSFRAPNFDELYGQEEAVLVNSPVPNQSAPAAVLFRVGSNPDLKPEKSMEWTAGFDVLPDDSIVKLNVTYFHIRFRNRIASPNIPALAALDQGSTYAPFIQSNPAPSELLAISQSANVVGNLTTVPGFGPPSSLLNAAAIADDRLQNVSALNVDGVDASADRRGEFGRMRYNIGLEGSYLLKYENVYLAGSLPQDLLSTFENPVNFRARAIASLGLHGVTAHMALNYTNDYHNTTGNTPRRIASWSTIDFGITYKLPAWEHFSESHIELSCTNCLNRLPPYTGIGGYVFAFDPANASPLGRFASVEVQAKW
jgi:iron complex outermembrane receptor protein